MTRPTVTVADGTATIHLTCLDADHAQAVATELHRPGDEFHNVAATGDHVAITYRDLRWPMDVAEWAHANGHAHDDVAAAVIVAVQVA
jgi:hypothetical protein